jgi:hypothetical protein
MAAQNFRSARVPNITAHVIERSHRRYGLASEVPEVSRAWSLLVDSAYAQDLSVQDKTGVAHLPGSSSQFEKDNATPTLTLCKIYEAWRHLTSAAAGGDVDPTLVTFRCARAPLPWPRGPSGRPTRAFAAGTTSSTSAASCSRS